MNADARAGRSSTTAPHPLALLLDCPQQVSALLQGSALPVDFAAGQVVFRQSDPCRGLYLILSGQLVRRAERLDAKVTLGTARTGDLVELAAALGDRIHTYTLSGQQAGEALLLPIEPLQQAFESYPPLRMHLLEELAREVSRAYAVGSLARLRPPRRRASEPNGHAGMGSI
jgi:CRP-like cAMP-binding protein